MIQEISLLVAEWEAWSQMAGMTGTSVKEIGAGEIRFCASDGDYHLKKDGNWWVVDESDERGKTYLATSTLSSAELAEKYLIWTWGSIARTAVGAEQLGRRFQQQGFNGDVTQAPASRANFIEIRTPHGIAIVQNSKSVVLSHVFPLSISQLDQTLRKGL